MPKSGANLDLQSLGVTIATIPDVTKHHSIFRVQVSPDPEWHHSLILRSSLEDASDHGDCYGSNLVELVEQPLFAADRRFLG